MADEWIGVIGTLIGVAAGGGITYFVTQSQIEHEERLDRSRRQLVKLEATHELFSKVSNQTNIMNMNLIGNLTYDLKLEPEKMGGQLPLDELQMHVDMYIPEASSKVEEIMEQWIELWKIASDVIMKPTLSSDERKSCIVKSSKIALDIARISREAKQIVVKHTKKYL